LPPSNLTTASSFGEGWNPAKYNLSSSEKICLPHAVHIQSSPVKPGTLYADSHGASPEYSKNSPIGPTEA